MPKFRKIRNPRSRPMQGVLGGCADEKGDRTLCEVKMRYTCSNIQDPKAAPVPRELSERPNFQGPSIRRQPAYLLSRSKPTRSARPESSLQVPRQSEEIEERENPQVRGPRVCRAAREGWSGVHGPRSPFIMNPKILSLSKPQDPGGCVDRPSLHHAGPLLRDHPAALYRHG